MAQTERPDASKKSGASGLPNVTPDLIEQEAGELIDNIVPTYGYQLMPMVGIGGSAGAIKALQAFFEAMPPDAGMSFVVILHLSPDHESTLTEMIQRWTKMKVKQAADAEKAEPNTVYVIPPAKHLTATNGHFRLTDLDREHGRRVAVDLFFRSLADTHGPHAAAIVLSGADGDGMLGIRRIKERGGLTIAQDPDEAEHDAMPRTAISSGMVDWVLPTAQMPERLLKYISTEKELQLPPEDGPQPASAPQPAPNEPEAAFREILVFLRTRTGRDFSYYKRATILRRISRRMQVNSVSDMMSYLVFLRTHPGEAGALLKDLLISVTNFFRDRDAFAALEKRIPDLFGGKGQGDTVRVWVPACATGEEAYSIAMLLIEYGRTLDLPPGIQVFGCDLDEDAVQAARAGIFPDAISADVSEERLRRFFVKEHHGYRVRREIREVVLFATHDLLKDAPFSRVDLISCRNLLIYLNREAQNRAFEIFHFALKPEGILFLGSSESVEDGSTLFRVLDKKNRIYTRKSSARVGLPVPTGPSTLLVRQIEQQVALEHAEHAKAPIVFPPPSFSRTAALALTSARASMGREEERISWSELHFKLIERFGPPSILVNRDHEVQHLSENSGRFLQLSGGTPTTNLLRLVHPALRLELRAALFRAAQTGQPAKSFQVPIDMDGQRRTVDIQVAPATDLAPDYFLVTFDLREPPADPAQEAPPISQPEPMVQHLEHELEQMKKHLRDTVEQYEASTEELKASNEELQAMNEELRSATEELETSREELQSINEELTTVNQELKNKVEELGHANSDLQNLMGATAIATVFLDRNMNIMRFTNSAAPIFSLIPSDIGRPIGDLQHHINYPEMTADATKVLETLAAMEREVTGSQNRYYLARMLPYRTIDDRIGGVVLTFVDITERQRAERALAEELRHTKILGDVSEKMTLDGNMQDLFDAMLNAAIGLTGADGGTVQLLNGDTRDLRLLATRGIPSQMVEQFARVDASSGTPCGAALAAGKRVIVDFDPSLPDPDGSNEIHYAAGFRSAQSTPLMSRTGRPIGMLSTHWKTHHRPTDRELRFLDLLARQAADAIERKQAAETLRDHVEELTRFNNAAVGRETRMIELKKEINELCARLGLPERYSLKFVEEAGDESG
jgi:two-component system CheB/CheR fusion protein